MLTNNIKKVTKQKVKMRVVRNNVRINIKNNVKWNSYQLGIYAASTKKIIKFVFINPLMIMNVKYAFAAIYRRLVDAEWIIKIYL